MGTRRKPLKSTDGPLQQHTRVNRSGPHAYNKATNNGFRKVKQIWRLNSECL